MLDLFEPLNSHILSKVLIGKIWKTNFPYVLFVRLPSVRVCW